MKKMQRSFLIGSERRTLFMLVGVFVVFAAGLTALWIFYFADIIGPSLFAPVGEAGLLARWAWFFAVLGVAVMALLASGGFLLFMQKTAIEEAGGPYEADGPFEESDQHFRAAFENTSVGMVIRNLRDLSLFVNPAFERMVGYSQEELEGMRLIDITHPEDHEKSVDVREKLMAGEGEEHQIGKRYIRKDGEILWVISERTMAYDDAGKPHFTINLYQDITERNRAEEALRRNEERFRKGLEDTGVGVVIRTIADEALFANRAFADMVGYSQDELKTMRLIELTHPDDAERSLELRDKLMAGEITDCQNSKRYIRKDGKLVWVVSDRTAVNDEAGEPLFIINFYQDITAHKQLEEALVRSEERLLNAQRIADIGNWEWNIPGDEFQWSDQIYRTFGHTAKSFGNSYGDFLSLVHPSDRDLVKEAMSKAVEDRTPCSFDHRIIRPDGAVRILHEEAEVSGEEGGTVYSISGTAQDITAVRETQRALEDKSRLLEAIFENMAQGVAVFDTDQVLVAVNEQFSKIVEFPPGVIVTGMNREEIVRYRAAQGLLGEGVDEDIIAARMESVRLGETRRNERVSPSGRTYIYERRPMPSGGTIMTVTDVTERREAEEHFRQAQKMEAIGELTSGVAHDFNNLLTAVMGNLQLIERKLGDDLRMKRQLGTALRASEKCADLTRRLLAFSRRQILAPKVLTVNELVDQLSELLRGTLGGRIDFTVSLDDGLWNCEADPGQLESAIVNIVLNARDAMPDGGQLSVCTRNVHVEEMRRGVPDNVPVGDYMCLSIADSGAGMTPEVLDKAVEPFFTTRGLRAGSGLGLSMVYGFIKQSGGCILFDTLEGKGTVVNMYLPRVENAKQKEAKNEHRLMATDINRGDDEPSAQGEKVLVVEDEPYVLQLTLEMLDELGYETVQAATGEEALSTLGHNQDIDILLSDVVLPHGMNGVEIAERAQNMKPDLKVLFMSGFTRDILAQQNDAGEGVHLINKPFEIAALARKLREVLD
jgi:PAS domain S-box-containing protein